MKTIKRKEPKPATKPNKELKLSRTHAPANLSPVDWQRRLRRPFGREQAFKLENLTSERAAGSGKLIEEEINGGNSAAAGENMAFLDGDI